MRSIVLLVLVGCSEIGLNDTSKGPELEFVQPVDGGRFNPIAPVSICAAVDYEGSLETLEVILVSDVGGTLATSGFIECDGGDLGIDVDLSAEPHVISMTVTDVQGRTSTDTASIVPIENTTPTCSVITPTAGANLPLDEDVTMIIRIDDLEGGLIEVQVDSTQDGLVASEDIAGSGNLQLDVSLTGGTQDLVVTATDDRGAAGVCAVSVELVECEDADNDGVQNCDGDCNDNDPAVYPGAVEVPDGQDNDCDGDIDEGTALFDDDGDGFTELDGDCDDTDPLVFPGQTEIPDDGIDQDCSGADRVTCYDDLDGDSFAGPTVLTEEGSCVQGSTTIDDCDDADPAVNPNGADIPDDGIDQDCSGNDAIRCFVDGDEDDYGSGATVVALDGTCDTSDGESDNDLDCDDTDDTVYPGAPEVVGDGIDQDCSGSDSNDCFVDADGDGYGTNATVSSADADCDDPGEAAQNGDCRPGNPNINPGATEIPDNGVDEDCSGDDSVSCFVDMDLDGYGTSVVVLAPDGSCDAVENEADVDGDCDDNNPALPDALGNCGGACAAQIVNPGDVIVTEVMVSPQDLGSTEGEWFEIYNTTVADITICGDWSFEDQPSGFTDIVAVDDPTLVLPAGGYLVFGSSNQVDPVDHVYPRKGGGVLVGMALSEPDELIVKFEGTIIDEVYWPNGWDTSGASMQLDIGSYDSLLNDDMTPATTPWCVATTTWPTSGSDRGTPGEDNLSCP